MTAHLLGIGTATPSSTLAQSEIEDLVIRLAPPANRERAIRGVFRRAGIERRASVTFEPSGAAPFFESSGKRGPPTGARVDRFLGAASKIAHEASVSALERARVGASEITHLITVSCTGFAAPGVEHALIASLGLRPTVRRTNIGFMGCHAAINALAVAKAFAEADANARVLVCCAEICSLHLQFTDEPDTAVANALFADGAAAAVVSARSSTDEAPAITATESVVIPDSVGAMGWRIGDHGFEMRLASSVPDTLAANVPDWVRGVLDRRELCVRDVSAWAIHPGGPRVLTSVASALELEESAVAASRGVLSAHGNMSSATVLFIIDELMRTVASLPLVALAFGPGLAGEALVLEQR